jgi:N-formylglutamate deformylase
MSADHDFLEIRRGNAPLIVTFPHTGTEIPPEYERRLVSPWMGRKDADWWIDQLYDFAVDLDATMIRTRMSRTVIDPNRDPSGVSLYPGQATTGLCPDTSFDGEQMYQDGLGPDEAEIAVRRDRFFDPYHATIAAEIARLKAKHGAVVLYDAHSIRSDIPRLFEGELPHFNIGTNSGASCNPDLAAAVQSACEATSYSSVLNGRFKGGYTTRHYGRPEDGVHAIQMELACRGYVDEPRGPVAEGAWPVPYDPAYAQPMRDALTGVLKACLATAHQLAGAKTAR